jgi:hypothetical protein
MEYFTMSVTRIRAAAALSLAAFSLVACGGGSSGTPNVPATPVPHTIPAPAAATSTTVVTVGTSAVSKTLPATGGIPSRIDFPAADHAANMTVTVATGSAITTIVPQALRRALSLGALPQGPYLVDLSFSPDQTITFNGPVNAAFDIGPLLSSDQKTALATLLLINPQLYVGVLDPAGNFTAIGPLGFVGTVVSAAIPASPLTLQAGQTYHIGLHLGPLTSATTAPTQAPTQAPTVAPTVAPTQAPTVAPTQAPTVAPTQAPTLAPSPVPSQTPSDTATQTIAAAGHAGTDADALKLPFAGGFSGAIGYPSNDSNVVSVLSTAYNGRPAGAPFPANETVDYAIQTTLSPGAPMNQNTITFQGLATAQVDGFVNVPFDSTTTFTVYVYAPALAGNIPIYTSSPKLAQNRVLTFASPFNSGRFTVPVPTTVYVEVAQP